MYTQESIEKVREADIVSVVKNYCLDLKKQGSSYFCKSPFTKEKTPSFNVKDGGGWVCYSSGQKGDAIKFVMLMEHCDFIEAVKKIALICNIFLQHEEVTEEKKRERLHLQDLLKLADNIKSKYVANYQNLPSNHWAVKHIDNLGYDKKTIVDFQIGYAYNNNEITNACIEKAKLSSAIAIGVTAQKNNKSYDFFRDRIIIPITKQNGETIAFAGRQLVKTEADKKYKWINGSTTEIYNKTTVLYALDQAKNEIKTSGYAILTEGYTDVITMHQHGCKQTIATCGTALTDTQCKLLYRLCEHVVLFRDGDAAGLAASKRDLKILLKNKFRVSIVTLPEGEDPDSFARKTENIQEYITKHIEDAVLWELRNMAQEGEKGTYEKSKAIKRCLELLMLIKDEIVKTDYLKQTASIFKSKITQLKSMLGELQKQATQESLRLKKGETKSLDNTGLPKGADREQFIRDRFCEVGNQYHFPKGEGFFPGTNFRITPLFHIKGKKENKRLCELFNTDNQKELIDLESESFVSFSDFKKQLIRLGYYIFLSGTTTSHFDLLAQKILKQFSTALELQNMGWNSKGFYAFSNGVFWQNRFHEVNKYGIVHLEGVDRDEEDEYNEKVEHYYSPASSVMHKKNQEGDDPYENDRKFVYKKSPITLLQWQKQMLTVFKSKGRIGILFNFAVLFRDLFLKNYDFFPLLGGFGEKDSGKSGFGKILQNFFFYNLEPLELNQSTLVGFNRRLSRTTNTTVFLDEYTDRIDEKMFQAMKGAWNGLGREKGMATNDKRTIYDKVNSAIYYAGQYLPTRDDNSLATRSICLQFPATNYSPQEKDDFNLIMAYTGEGLSSLISEIIEHRKHFETNLPRVFSEITQQLKIALADQEYQERIFSNYLVLLITHKLLSDKIKIPFSYDTIFNQCVEGIIENSESIQDSNGLTEFWNILQWMYERQYIKEGAQFIISRPVYVNYIGSQKETMKHLNKERRRVLFLRLNSVHQDYIKEVTKREGIDAIGETTLRNYFRSRNYFIGLIKAKRFDTGVSSCYAFDYDKMLYNNIVNLGHDLEEKDRYKDDNDAQEKIIDEDDNDAQENTTDELPF
jgi:DNA primase